MNKDAFNLILERFHINMFKERREIENVEQKIFTI